MADKGRWPGDLYVAGVLTADELKYPSGSIGDEEIDAAAAIDTLKVNKQYVKTVVQPAAVVNRTEPIHVAFAKGTLVDVEAGMIVPPTVGATVTIDVLKNGVTVLAAPLVLNNANVARVAASAGITPPGTYVADDWFDVQVTIAVPSGVIGSGLIVRLVFREDPA